MKQSSGKASKASVSAEMVAPMGRRLVLTGMLSLALASCGASAVETFNLSALKHIGGTRRRRGQLVVMEPIGGAPYDNDRIVVRTARGTIAYLKGAQWTEQLPQMLQSRVIQTLENGKIFRAVGRPGDRLVAKVSLNMEIRRFDIDIKTGQAVVEISAKLINDSLGRAIVARIFTASVPASAASGGKATAALDLALAALLRDLAAWTARYV